MRASKVYCQCKCYDKNIFYFHGDSPLFTGYRQNRKKSSEIQDFLQELHSLHEIFRFILKKQNYGNGNYIEYTYDNLDRITEKKYNGDANNRAVYRYGNDGSLAQTVDFSTGTRTKFTYDLADRLVTQKEYTGTGANGGTLRNSTEFTYADKTNYLTGVKHFSPLGTQNIGYTYGNVNQGQMPDQVYKVSWNGQEKLNYTYDGLGRLTNKTILVGGGVSDTPNTLNTQYTYFDVGTDKTTSLLKTLQTPAGTYNYTYDAVGNITSISDGTYTTSYAYDALNQLARENDQKANKTYTYAYVNGNITERTEYAYTTGELGEVLDTKTWAYTDGSWSDLLTSFNGISISYDLSGNPTAIGNQILTWNGRQLQSITNGSNTYSYAYNTDEQRVSKTVNGVTTEYFYNGEILAGQKTGDDILVFMYDNDGDPFGFTYNGTEHFYVKNAQNDVVALLDSNKIVIAEYSYDAWGNCTVSSKNWSSGSSSGWIQSEPINMKVSLANPIRYRSYYFDRETNLYYLNSRYYSPEMCRFLNADDTDVLEEDQDSMLEENLFAYCLNNPVNMADDDGTVAWWIAAAVTGAAWDAAFYCVEAAITGNFSWKGLGKAALKGAVTGLAFGAVGKIAGKAVKAVKVARTAKKAGKVKKTSKVCSALTKITGKSFCFVAGTEVLTDRGLVPIEEIQVGDLVWAEDPDTGEKTLKPVVQLFVSETHELVRLVIDDEIILATLGHPFHVKGKGWVQAFDLEPGDLVTQKDGNLATVYGIWYIYSETPVTVYNFEVADFHTYFVGDDSLLVHNMCAKSGGMNNLRVLKERIIKGYKISMDLEKGGSGLNNIHLKVNNVKYFYQNGEFISSTGRRLPKSLRNNRTIRNAVDKALDAIERGF